MADHTKEINFTSNGATVCGKIPASNNSQYLSFTNTTSQYRSGINYNIIDPDLDIAEQMEMKNYYYNMIIEELKNEYQTVTNNLLEVKINDAYIELYDRAANYAKAAYDKLSNLI